MKKQILALCDKEAEYTRRFCEYVGKKKDIPFEVAAFTSKEKLEDFCREEDVDLLLVDEGTYDISLKEVVKGDVILLREDEAGYGDDNGSIYKYQSCESVLREVMCYCADTNPSVAIVHRTKRDVDIKMIALYTPVHRTLQTTLALTMGEVLAKKHKTLYLNFESFSGWEQRIRRSFDNDISDLMYYASNTPEALYYKLKGMTQKLRWLEYVPPAFSYLDLSRIDMEQWFSLFKEIERQCDYEYLILDLSDNIQGLFEIMRACCRIYTLIRDDGAAAGKLYHYEKFLERTENEDIKEKTINYKLPLIKNLPENFMDYAYGRLADIAMELLGEDILGGDALEEESADYDYI